MIPLDWVNETHITLNIVKKNQLCFVFVNDVDDKNFDFVQMMQDEFNFMPHQFISNGPYPFDFDFLLFYLLNLSLEGVEERFYELSWVESVKL